MNKFTVEQVDEQRERRQRLMKVAGLSTLAVAVVTAGAGLAWYLTPPAMPESIEEASAMVESARFQRLSDEDKQPYMDTIREQFGSLNRDERRQLMQNSEALRQEIRENRMQEMEDRLRDYALADEAEREQMLAEFMANRPERAGRGGEGGPRGGPSVGRMSDRVVNGNPQTRAYFSDFFRRMRNRTGGMSAG